MLSLLAIPLFIMSGLPNKPPNPEKSSELISRQPAEMHLELCCSSGIRIFNVGNTTHFGLNKTALAPLQEKRSKPDCPLGLLENVPAKELPGARTTKKNCGEADQQPVELVSPLILNLAF